MSVVRRALREELAQHGEDWSQLVGRALEIAPRHFTLQGESAARMTVPGACRIELQVRGVGGVMTLRGRVAVMATSWG